MSDDEQHNQTFDQVTVHLSPFPTYLVLIWRVQGQCWGLPHFSHAMLCTPQEWPRCHQEYVVTSVGNGYQTFNERVER
jgi:hypothetical protein